MSEQLLTPIQIGLTAAREAEISPGGI